MDIFTNLNIDKLFDVNINIWNVILRLFVSIIIGAAIGIPQEKKGRPAGLRTHIVITMGASITMMISIYITQYYNIGDPGRIAAQVVSGIGFLGAGAIIKYGFNVIGLTTAASIWTTAMIGLAVGIGLYPLALISTFLLFVVLAVIKTIQKKTFKRSKKLSEIAIKSKETSMKSLYDDVKEVLKDYDVKITTVSLSSNKHLSVSTITFEVRQPRNLDIFDVVDSLKDKIKKIESIELKHL